MTVVPYTRPGETRAWLTLQNPALELANAIAGTDFVPQHLRGNPAAITAAILYGDEVGIGPMQSLAHIAVINGRPTLAAETQRALILAAGHDLWIEESTITRCTVAGQRKDSDATSRITWTMDDAKRAGIAGKPPWRQYPRQMLLARASAELARAVFPDAIGGLAATEELEGETLEPTGNGGEPKAETTSRRRRRANVSAPATTPNAPEPPQVELPPLPGEDEPNLMNNDQRKRMMAGFRTNEFEDRGARLRYSSAIIGRDIKTSKELTFAEASMIIDHLEAKE